MTNTQSYFSLGGDDDVDGGNQHRTLHSAAQACAADCECIGIVLAMNDEILVIGAVLSFVLGVPALLILATVSSIWFVVRAKSVLPRHSMPLLTRCGRVNAPVLACLGGGRRLPCVF